MSAEVTKIDSLGAEGDYLQIKVAAAFKGAYIDRYARLGYREVSGKTEEAGGKTYAVVVMKREFAHPQYSRLSEIERQVEGLLATANSMENHDGKKIRSRRVTLNVMLWAGIVILACGVALLVYGFINSFPGYALGGWGAMIVGAIAIIVWSFLRESWRMRKRDIADDAENPGFGIDNVSREIEKKLEEADALCGNTNKADGGKKGKKKQPKAKDAAPAAAPVDMQQNGGVNAEAQQNVAINSEAQQNVAASDVQPQPVVETVQTDINIAEAQQSGEVNAEIQPQPADSIQADIQPAEATADAAVQPIMENNVATTEAAAGVQPVETDGQNTTDTAAADGRVTAEK